MKTVAAVATIFGMVGAVAAQTNCCPARYIIDSTFTPGDPTQFVRRLGPKRNLQGAGSPDTGCVSARAAIEAINFPAPDPANTDVWMVKGDDTYVETLFTREIIEVPLLDNYWNQEDAANPGTPTPVTEASRVLVVRVGTAAPSGFTTAWTGASSPDSCDVAAACVECATEDLTAGSEVTWTNQALIQLADKGASVVILADTTVAADWVTAFDNKAGAAPTYGCGASATTCPIFAGTDSGDLLEDVKAALGETCDVCSIASTTTTTAAGGAPTTTVPGGNPPVTTAAATTTTADGNSAGRLVAGMVPVATAALLALVM